MNRILHLPALVILFLSSLFSCISEDPDSLESSEIFIKYYGSESEEKAVDLLELNDGFLLLGSRTDVDNSDFYLVRTDTAGNRLWEGVINYDTVGTYDIPSKMYLDEVNSQLYVIGTSSFDRGDDALDRVLVDHMFIAKVDITSTGFTVTDTLLYRYYDSRTSTNLSYTPSYKSTTGSDLMVVGEDLLILGSVVAGSNDPSSSDNSILLMRMTKDFATTSWERVKGFTGDDYGVSLLEANGQYFYMGSITTTSGVGNGGVDVLLEEFNIVSGNENNVMEYGTGNNDEPKSIIFTNPGIAIVGTTGGGSAQYGFMINTSRNLGTASLKLLTYSVGSTDQTWNTEAADVAYTSTGGYFVVGNVNSFSDDAADPRENEVLLMPVNGFGEVVDADVQEYGSVQNDEGNAIIRRADGSMVVAATVHFGGSATMMSLLKTNRNGRFRKN